MTDTIQSTKDALDMYFNERASLSKSPDGSRDSLNNLKKEAIEIVFGKKVYFDFIDYFIALPDDLKEQVQLFYILNIEAIDSKYLEPILSKHPLNHESVKALTENLWYIETLQEKGKKTFKHNTNRIIFMSGLLEQPYFVEYICKSEPLISKPDHIVYNGSYLVKGIVDYFNAKQYLKDMQGYEKLVTLFTIISDYRDNINEGDVFKSWFKDIAFPREQTSGKELFQVICALHQTFPDFISNKKLNKDFFSVSPSLINKKEGSLWSTLQWQTIQSFLKYQKDILNHDELKLIIETLYIGSSDFKTFTDNISFFKEECGFNLKEIHSIIYNVAINHKDNKNDVLNSLFISNKEFRAKTHQKMTKSKNIHITNNVKIPERLNIQKTVYFPEEEIKKINYMLSNLEEDKHINFLYHCLNIYFVTNRFISFSDYAQNFPVNLKNVFDILNDKLKKENTYCNFKKVFSQYYNNNLDGKLIVADFVMNNIDYSTYNSEQLKDMVSVYFQGQGEEQILKSFLIKKEQTIINSQLNDATTNFNKKRL